MDNPILKAALWYSQKMGFSVIPMRTDQKRPDLEDWKCWQEKRADEKQIRQWWDEKPNANIGIVTGVISKISVIDIDLSEMNEDEIMDIQELLPVVETPTVISGRGGKHLYFQYNALVPNSNRILGQFNGSKRKIDSKNNGGVIIAPPSIIAGKKYQWQSGLAISKIPIIKLPSSYINIISRLYTPIVPISTKEKRNIRF